MKKIFNIIIVTLMLLVLVSCDLDDKNDFTKLDTPVVRLEDDYAVWSAVDNLTEWEICINGSYAKLNSGILKYKLSDNYSFKIKAVGDGINYLDSDWSNEVIYSEKQPELNEICSKIQNEYINLKNGTTTEHTTWNLSGKIVELEVKFNSKYNNYNVKAIVDLGGLLVGIYNGFINGNYPVVVNGLNVGTTINFIGTISENYSLTLNGRVAEIEFANPEMSWEGMNSGSNDGEDTSHTVNFFMINDTHGAFVDSGEAVSIGRVDTLISDLENTNGDYIKIHNGDALQGTYVSSLSYGRPIIEALNIMDFDCFVLGNHEFDWGLDKIEAYKDNHTSNGEANFPFLGANIFYKGTNNRPDWIDEYCIVEYGDIEVGIIGVIGASQESSILTSNVADYEFVDPVSIINNLSKELRTNQGCEVVVVATHDYDEGLNYQIASLSNDSHVDAIFCAHTHQHINETVTRSDGATIPVVQNTHKNNSGTDLKLNFDKNNNLVGYKTKTYYPSGYAISSRLAELINSYNDMINDSNYVLGSTPTYISRQNLGAYAVDAMLDYVYENSAFDGEIDCAIINTGGVRATIDEGEITKSDVFEVFPFNNAVVLVNISGKLIKSLYNNNSGYLYIDVEDSIGSYSNLDDDTIYQLAVIDYVFESTYYEEFKNLTTDDYTLSGIVMRDILIEYIDELYN